MNPVALWSRILERATIEFEIPTVPIVRRTPLWFRVSLDGNVLLIYQAQNNAPSSKLKIPRLKGASISQKAIGKSVNIAYIYGLIANTRTNIQ